MGPAGGGRGALWGGIFPSSLTGQNFPPSGPTGAPCGSGRGGGPGPKPHRKGLRDPGPRKEGGVLGPRRELRDPGPQEGVQDPGSGGTELRSPGRGPREHGGPVPREHWCQETLNIFDML